MFYEGDLQSGLTEAIQKNKLVACFVRDNESESVIWEEEFLKDPTLKTLLMRKTILIRLMAGSQEAGFLAAIYPLPKTPTLVIIQSNGQLKEYLAAGISKADFMKRVLVAFGEERDMSSSLATGSISRPASLTDSNDDIASVSLSNTMPTEEQNLMAMDVPENGRASMEGERKGKVTAEKATSTSLTGSETEPSRKTGVQNPNETANVKHALLQKKLQQDARMERARILKRIEDDKAERRVKDDLGKVHAALAEDDDLKQSSTHAKRGGVVQTSVSNKASDCAIQVRLFDGTTIRSRFSSQNTPREHIRQWVDSQRPDGDVPYILKQILTPLPNRTLSISEEEESLESLGLTPTATLVLVPVREYTSAYAGGSTDYFSKGIYVGLGLISSGMNIVSGALSSLVGRIADPRSNSDDSSSTAATASGAAGIRTIRDQQAYPEEHQLYNGNALNFEPRKDEDGED